MKRKRTKYKYSKTNKYITLVIDYGDKGLTAGNNYFIVKPQIKEQRKTGLWVLNDLGYTSWIWFHQIKQNRNKKIIINEKIERIRTKNVKRIRTKNLKKNKNEKSKKASKRR